MGMAADFYQTVSGVSFTLLGLWLAVVQLVHDGWLVDRARHRETLHIGLHFFLPGTVALAALLSGSADGGLIWRVVFVIGGAIGLVESLAYLFGQGGPRTHTGRFLQATDPALYALLAAGAFLPARLLALEPLQVEGMITGLLFVSGLCSVWRTLSARQPAS